MPISAHASIKKVALLASCLLLIGFGWWWSHRNLQATDDAYVEADVSALSAEVEGLVENVAFKAHQPVKKGDLLIELRSDYFKAALSVAEAGVAKAEANLDEAKASAQKSQNDLARTQHLATSNVSSQQSLDDAKVAVDQAKARVEAAEAGLALAIAERDHAQLDLDHTKIYAPFDGILGDSTVQAGTYVHTGSQLVMLIPQAYYVTANFKETQISKMRAGQKATLRFDSLPDKTYEGQIDSLSAGTGSTFALLPPENATGNFTKIVQRVPVRISLPQDAALMSLLRAGLSVEVTVDVAQ
jgi:membrane fusion protein (multidrug efflux system)